MPYRAPLAEFRFIFEHIVDFAQLTQHERFADAGAETVDAVLDGAGKLAQDVLAPLNRGGDAHPAYLKDGIVQCSPGYAEGYREIAAGGWVAVAASAEHGGMGLPLTLASAVNEMFASGCLSLQLNPLLTQGQIEALEHHAEPALKALYLPKLTSGVWNGTMNLTEAQAGSDVGALRSKAHEDTDGSYKISGQKIYITWGDGDFMENTVHLVLARLPGAAPGAKGVSLFLVPKYLPDAAGAPGAANSLEVVSLEHKLGIHGSPTCVMQFNEARGWLVGAPHAGMAAMFTMMNNARLGVGIQGIGVAERAYQKAWDYACTRVQGRTADLENPTIIGHADVRRMLATMKAHIFAARSIALSCSVASDMARATGDRIWQARAAFLTPITKSYGTEVGEYVASQGVQIHGGMGYVEETGAAQHMRDVRITSIYEGTNGIQAMDLVSRKMLDNGETALLLIAEVEATARSAQGTLPDLSADLLGAAQALRAATETIIRHDMNDRFAWAASYTRGFALVLGAHFHLKAALAEPQHEGKGGARSALARVALKRLLPEYAGLLGPIKEGAADLYALSAQDLA